MNKLFHFIICSYFIKAFSKKTGKLSYKSTVICILTDYISEIIFTTICYKCKHCKIA